MTLIRCLAQLKTLVNCSTNAKKLGIYVILDFVPNHTSDQHEWFKLSESREPDYEDYYIWHPGKMLENGTRVPPSNWISVMKGPAWTFSEIRGEYYYHCFSSAQPDLNFRSQKVVDEMKNVLRFWLAKGISGFRVDAVQNLFETGPDEDGNIPNEPLSGECDDDQNFCYLNHIHIEHKDETLDMVYQWREVLDEFSGDEPKIMMTEAFPPLDLLTKYYQNGTRQGAQIPFNFEIIYKLDETSTAKDWRQVIENYLNYVPNNHLPNWVLGNHDRNRIASRLGKERIDLFNVLLQTLPGNAITYQGEEIGMENAEISWEDTEDPQACNTNSSVYHLYSRDPVRTPMQWNASRNAGFSLAAKTWLPVHPNYADLNVAGQEKDDRSHLGIFKKLTKLRQEPAFKKGLYMSASRVHEDIFVYLREYEKETYLIVLNFGKSERSFRDDFAESEQEFRGLSGSQKVVLDTSIKGYAEGQTLQLINVKVNPNAALILKATSSGTTISICITLILLSAILTIFK